MLLVDLILSFSVALLLSWIFLRYVKEHGPWRRPWAFALAIFLFAWAGGAWVAPGLGSGWTTYWVPFLIVGLVTALMIVAISPTHDLGSDEDVDQFEREKTAVVLSISFLTWVLAAMLVGSIIAAYLR